MKVVRIVLEVVGGRKEARKVEAAANSDMGDDGVDSG